ncbi:Anti-anti-sigma regulatory factor (antagonist of anti-sigma factor) [Parafrankia irregularis]|uniref:Anti-anti-sigma regulatory factor (Antagonist of anti-sigma factor) n=2 Tax=Frankiaceae TaxID=74712 RepID=A0A0S4QS65_9ACTN|nr:STAS domain-containing protein [Parafrankia sp. CH37]CUU58587.1 Anti-anti-sigma regulatory factor (antagonist of anti-sigma factor) [Parafrankia irregularis]
MLTIGEEADTLIAGPEAAPSTSKAASTPTLLPLGAPSSPPVMTRLLATVRPSPGPGTGTGIEIGAGAGLAVSPPATVTGHRPDRPLRARVEQRAEGAVIHLSGLLAAGAIGAARAAVDDAATPGPRDIVIDLAGVHGADPLGAVLLGAMSRHAARRGCRLRLRAVGPPVLQVLAERGVRVEFVDPHS